MDEIRGQLDALLQKSLHENFGHYIHFSLEINVIFRMDVYVSNTVSYVLDENDR